MKKKISNEDLTLEQKKKNIYGDDWIYIQDDNDRLFMDPTQTERRSILDPRPSPSDYNYEDSIVYSEPFSYNYPKYLNEIKDNAPVVREPVRGVLVPGEDTIGRVNDMSNGILTRRFFEANEISPLKKLLKKYGFLFISIGDENNDRQNWRTDKNVGVPKGDKEIYVRTEEKPKATEYVNTSNSPELNLPASTSKVIPEYYTEYLNKQANLRTPQDSILDFFIRNTSMLVKKRSKRYITSVRRIIPQRNIVEFNVRYGAYRSIVTLYTDFTSPNILENNDFKLRCTCGFWRWQGPEHWALQYGYLFGKRKGTGTFPKKMDPGKRHVCCKHVYSTLMFLKNPKNLEKIKF